MYHQNEGIYFQIDLPPALFLTESSAASGNEMHMLKVYFASRWHVDLPFNKRRDFCFLFFARIADLGTGSTVCSYCNNMLLMAY